jgi:type I restriction-modification system DNA methylase subunit
MLAYIKSECFVRAVVALPSRTFYSTPKKTYILALEKHDPGAIQTDPVFTYLVSEIGESRDARRISIDANDLTDMQVQFRYFETNRRGFKYTDPRCRVVEWNSFGALSNWLIDRLWTREDKIALGILEESVEVDVPTFRGLVEDARRSLDDLLGELQ